MRNTQQRVFITGMGAVTALGCGVSPLWDAAVSGKSGVKPLALPRIERQLIKTAAYVEDHNLETSGLAVNAASVDRFSVLALIAAREALHNAQWQTDAPLGERTAVIIGSGIGGASTFDLEHYKFYVTKERGDTMAIPKVMPSAATSHVSMAHGATGPSFAVSSACSSSSQAIGLGLVLLRSGLADRALVGGSECLLTPASFRAWEGMRVLTPTLCRPFSAGRNGMVLGEGSAVLLLETEQALTERSARPLAELAGFGTNSDAGDLLRPDAQRCARAMALALEDAGIAAAEVGYLNAHGTGTIINDRAETAALQLVFGSNADHLAVSSTKPVHGHALGAAGAIELVVTVEALRHQIAPPTINWTGPDPSCVPSPVPNVPLPQNFSVAMSNSFAFGGINACLVIRKA